MNILCYRKSLIRLYADNIFKCDGRKEREKTTSRYERACVVKTPSGGKI